MGVANLAPAQAEAVAALSPPLRGPNAALYGTLVSLGFGRGQAKGRTGVV